MKVKGSRPQSPPAQKGKAHRQYRCHRIGDQADAEQRLAGAVLQPTRRALAEYDQSDAVQHKSEAEIFRPDTEDVDHDMRPAGEEDIDARAGQGGGNDEAEKA